jgi:hypothetical protein
MDGKKKEGEPGAIGEIEAEEHESSDADDSGDDRYRQIS